MTAADEGSRNDSTDEQSEVDAVDEQAIEPQAVSSTYKVIGEFSDPTGAGRHIGPMAEDFCDAFGLGKDECSIPAVDADGFALAAIQGLAERLDECEARIDDRAATIEKQRERIEARGTTIDD